MTLLPRLQRRFWSGSHQQLWFWTVARELSQTNTWLSDNPIICSMQLVLTGCEMDMGLLVRSISSRGASAEAQFNVSHTRGPNGLDQGGGGDRIGS